MQTQPLEATREPAAPVIVLVGADKGGVGKPTVARALADYTRTLEPRLIDTQVPAGDLRGFTRTPKYWICLRQPGKYRFSMRRGRLR